MNKLEFLVRDLPSPEAARRFFEQFSERNPSQTARLQKDEGLFSDVLTLASYSPLLATTLIQNPNYVAWLGRKRGDSSVRGKDELLESLARFALTNSQLEPHVLLARFRRRELLRIFLRDVRRLGTIAEVTEEISNLADAILENALRLAQQEMDNRYGAPFEIDENGKKRSSDVCIVSLGKLGSKELNYSSDIDLLFIYSTEGSTTGTGTRGSLSNREYFVKLAETVTQLVGRQTGEGAAYRVDMRLRPHGRVGALALSLKETVRYYLKDARSWEQQVLIRSRASAGNANIFRNFFAEVEDTVFKPGRDAAEALREVFRSKEKIDYERRTDTVFDVKLGRGGIREIEFIAQALQLAHGGQDRWLRVPHTLISISRLADRHYLTEDERSCLSNAYDFLRRLEHILQMEHGLQTHSLPSDVQKLESISAKMACGSVGEFEGAVAGHTANVHKTFLRVFGAEAGTQMVLPEPVAKKAKERISATDSVPEPAANRLENEIVFALEKLDSEVSLNNERAEVIHRISAAAPKFAQVISARPWLVEYLKRPLEQPPEPDYKKELSSGIDITAAPANVLHDLRTVWSRLLLDIVVADIYEALPIEEVRRRQTLLAEASIDIALQAAAKEVSRKYSVSLSPLSVLALGKLGGGTLDYDSDLDVILVYQEKEPPSPVQLSLSELNSRLAESFVNLLSGMTREGNLYRVDLRLRPHGKNGPNVTTAGALADYIKNEASIWELLAYVQMREVGTDGNQCMSVETAARDIIKNRIASEDAAVVRRDARNMRLRLEKKHGDSRSGREINIKFGPGGLLDVYFITRYLQLLHCDSVEPAVRSTAGKLNAFREAGLLSTEDHAALSAGHDFLSTVDHNIRLIVGRSSWFPRANQPALERIAARMRSGTVSDLMQEMSIHRMNIRDVFERILYD